MRSLAITGLLGLLGTVFFGAGCPLAHDDYDTGRSCHYDLDCPADEVCATPDASITEDGGRRAESLCYAKADLVPCFPDDAGVAAYYCFSADQHCVHVPRTCISWTDAGCDQDAGCGDAGASVDAGCALWQPEYFGCESSGGAQ